MWFFGRPSSVPKTDPSAPETPERRGAFLTHGGSRDIHNSVIRDFNAAIAGQPYGAVGMDDTGAPPSFKAVGSALPTELLAWYASQRFIGYQTCAMISQHWLVDKACAMPARDAVRHGFGVQVYGDRDPLTDDQVSDITERVQRADRRYRLAHNLREHIRMGRIFGIRVAFFKVKHSDPDYYEKPFNPDGIVPGSYQGIVQVDPYWCNPMLSIDSASDPTSMHFYEPEWWIINGKRFHRSHLCIFRNGDVPDLIKPMYNYGGIPVPQRIFERVYAAERTANEGPQLAMTKRLTVQNTDLSQAYANQEQFLQHMQNWSYYRDNFGVKFADTDDAVTQFDTSLADLDAVIMTQYQIVAAAAGVPATKLLGTTPKGFQSTGEYESDSYHEELESIQAGDLTELVNRHHMMVMRSEVEPAMGLPPGSVRVEVDWLPVDSPTAKEYAEINQIKAATDVALLGAGVIDAIDIRNRLRGDANSEYADLEEIETPGDPDDEDILGSLGLGPVPGA